MKYDWYEFSSEIGEMSVGEAETRRGNFLLPVCSNSKRISLPRQLPVAGARHSANHVLEYAVGGNEKDASSVVRKLRCLLLVLNKQLRHFPKFRLLFQSPN